MNGAQQFFKNFSKDLLIHVDKGLKSVDAFLKK